MKLLGWMHRKLRQNNTAGEVPKDLGGGGPCTCLSARPSLDEDLHRRRHRQYEPFKARSLRLDADEMYDGSGGGDSAMEELFGSLLNIGTLGIGSWPIEEKEEDHVPPMDEEEEEWEKPVGAEETELIITPAALEAIAEKGAEATTEMDLMVVGAELEKALAVEAGKEGGRISSARSSLAGSAVCPLQGFLFGSPIEMAAAAGAIGRKERRASLAELFMMNRIAEDGSGGKGEEAKFAGGEGGRDGEEKATAEMCLMKKMAKRRVCKGSDGGGGAANGSVVETKIQKILQMFHRKVHPESSIMAKKSSKNGKFEKKDYVPLIGGINLNGEYRKVHITNFNLCSNLPSHSFGGTDLGSNREHWIKTDADYLVLEL